MGMRGRETRHRKAGLTLHHPPQRRVPRRATSNREAGVGALEASRDTETGQEASRAAPVPGPTAEQGTREAMVGQD